MIKQTQKASSPKKQSIFQNPTENSHIRIEKEEIKLYNNKR